MDTKCQKCGLVNWQGAVECSRCSGVLGLRSKSAGVNPFENSENKSSGGVVKIVAGLVLVLAAGFAAFQFTKQPEKPAKAAAANANSTPREVLSFTEVEAAETKVLDEIKSNSNKIAEELKAGPDYKQIAEQRRQCQETGKASDPNFNCSN